MRQVILLSLLLCFLEACNNKDSLPNNIIQPKAMQNIVWDMLQADEVAFQNKLKDSTISLKTESFKLYDQVFAIHKTTRDQFYKSYTYYQQHPHLYKGLMVGIKSIADKEKKKVLNPEKLR